MKNSITLLALLLSLSMFGQDPYLQKGENDVLKAKADSITDIYTKELAMSAKQASLFEINVEKYLIEREKIEQAYSGREMLKRLTRLQELETRAMNDVLTRPQMMVYKKMKPRVQPLATVKN